MPSIVGVSLLCSGQPCFWQKQEGVSLGSGGCCLYPAMELCWKAEGMLAVLTWEGRTSSSWIYSGTYSLNFRCVLNPCMKLDW